MNFDPDAIKARMAKQFRSMRDELGITQAELAKRINKSIHHVRKVESGENHAPLYSLLYLAHATGRPLDEVFGFKSTETLSGLLRRAQEMVNDRKTC